MGFITCTGRGPPFKILASWFFRYVYRFVENQPMHNSHHYNSILVMFSYLCFLSAEFHVGAWERKGLHQWDIVYIHLPHLCIGTHLILLSFLFSLSIGVDGHDCKLEVGYFVLNKPTDNFAMYTWRLTIPCFIHNVLFTHICIVLWLLKSLVLFLKWICFIQICKFNLTQKINFDGAFIKPNTSYKGSNLTQLWQHDFNFQLFFPWNGPIFLLAANFALLNCNSVNFALQWTFHPFILQTKRFYTVLIWRRVLAFLCVSVSLLQVFFVISWSDDTLVSILKLTGTFFFLQASQFLRIITFYATQLPGPNYHCHEVSDFVISWLLCAMSLWLGNTFVNLIIHRAHLWLDYHHPRMQLKSFWLIVSGDSLCVNILCLSFCMSK